MTLCGFCVVAALSSQMMGLPWTRSCKIGKSRRMAWTSKDCEERFKPGSVWAGARYGSFLAGIVVAGVSWRISSRNGKGEGAPGTRCCGTPPGTCGVESCGFDSHTCGVAVEEKLFASARSSVSPGMLTLGRGGATGIGDASEYENSGRISSRNPKEEMLEKSVPLTPPGIPGKENSGAERTSDCAAFPDRIAGSARRPASVGSDPAGS